MSSFQPVSNNPVLGYRLDPYEPGLIRQAKASQSTARVVSHEHRNLTRLTRQAVQEGRVIISRQITYRPTIAGSYMGTAAGKTTVVSRQKAEKEPAYLKEDPEKDGTNDEVYAPDSAKNGGVGLSTPVPSEMAQATTQELNQEEQKLRTEIRRINTEIEQAEEEKEYDEEENPGALKVELEEKRKDLQEVTNAKISKSQADLMATINEGIEKGNQAVIGLLKAVYDSGNDSMGQNFDVFV